MMFQVKNDEVVTKTYIAERKVLKSFSLDSIRAINTAYYHAQVCNNLNINKDKLLLMEQVHSNNIKVISAESNKKSTLKPSYILPQTDGIITNLREIYIGINTADCVPVLLYDPKTSYIGAIHIGLMGFANDVLTNTIRVLSNNLALDKQNILFYLGHAIGSCCYKISSKDKRLSNIPTAYFDNAIKTSKKEAFIDLKQLILNQLRDSGINESNINISDTCTVHNENLPSHRREGLKRNKTMISLIALKEKD